MNPQFQRKLFPDAPPVRAAWTPVYLEPMPGSGERITIAVAAVGSDGEHVVLDACVPKTIRCVFGEKSDGIFKIARLIITDLRHHLSSRKELSAWIAPISGASVGSIRPALGNSLQQVAERGRYLTASMFGYGFGSVEMAAQELKPEFSGTSDRWALEIRKLVSAAYPGIAPLFNKDVVVRSGAAPTTIGYLGRNLAANFDALIPNRSMTTRRNRAKARLVDLQILRDQIDLLPRTSYELMLWVPTDHDIAFDRGSLSVARSVFSELEEFGDKHSLRVIGMNDPAEAASRIANLEAA